MSRLSSVLLFSALFLAAPTSALAQDCGGVGDAADCDGDGVTVGAGDCDDNAAEVRPGATEICADELDNNCDGIFDENCDRSAQLGTARGGGGCTGGAGVAGTAFLLLPWLPGWRRRKRDGDRPSEERSR